MSLEPLVSVVIPAFNRPELLDEAIGSVGNQSYGNWELIVVDDGSTDPKVQDILERTHNQYGGVFHSIRTENAGPGRARQVGLEASAGKYIQFLDSDDLLLPDKLTLQVAGLEHDPDCILSYGKTREYLIGNDPGDRAARRTGDKISALYPDILAGRIWATETPLYRKSVLDTAGPWSDLRVLEDWEYECRVGIQGGRLHYCDAFVSEHRHHGENREGAQWRWDNHRFQDLLRAHEWVLGHGKTAGVKTSEPQMQYFSRNLFRLSREAADRDLLDDARHMFELAKSCGSGHSIQYSLHGLVVRLLGWQRGSRLSEKAIRLRYRAQRL